MAGLNVSIAFGAIAPDGADVSSPSEVNAGTLGAHATKHNETVTTTDGTFSLDGVTVPSAMRVKNLAEIVVVTQPAAPTIATQGTAGSTSYSYAVVAVQAGGTQSIGGLVGTIATGNAVLGTTNYNQITWAAVPGAASYNVYRTASGGTPATTGKIASVTSGLTLNDTGLVGDGTTMPATAADNVLLVGTAAATYQIRVKPQEAWVFRWNGQAFAAIHRIANTATIDVEVNICDFA